MFKGIGMDLKDPFEQFRKNKSAGFIQRMRARDEARDATKGLYFLSLLIEEFMCFGKILNQLSHKNMHVV